MLWGKYGDQYDGHKESCLSSMGKVIFVRQARFLLQVSCLSPQERDNTRPFKSPDFKPLLVYTRSAHTKEDLDTMIHGLYLKQLWGEITLRIFKAAEEARVFDLAI